MFGLDGVRCMLMRGGTSKGAFFVADDLPDAETSATSSCWRMMGSRPTLARSTAWAAPIRSRRKVAIVGAVRSARRPTSTYLFLQVGVDEPLVTDRQNCGNMLAGVGPFADRARPDRRTRCRARPPCGSTWSTPTRSPSPPFPLATGRPVYSGDTTISTACPAPPPPFGSTSTTSPAARVARCCPTGNVVDEIDGVDVHADRQRHARGRDARRPTSASPATSPASTLEANERSA